jgi:hypothetical protein
MTSPPEHVIELIFGRWRSQILYAGAALGVFAARGSSTLTQGDGIARRRPGALCGLEASGADIARRKAGWVSPRIRRAAVRLRPREPSLWRCLQPGDDKLFCGRDANGRSRRWRARISRKSTLCAMSAAAMAISLADCSIPIRISRRPCWICPKSSAKPTGCGRRSWGCPSAAATSAGTCSARCLRPTPMF